MFKPNLLKSNFLFFNFSFITGDINRGLSAIIN